jgi:hypothetical protein
MRRDSFWQWALVVIAILLAMNVLGPWFLMPSPSQGARPTEYKVVSLLDIPLDTPKGDVMHTPMRQLAKDKAKATAEALQQTLNAHAKDGWELHSVDVASGMLVLKK